MTFHATEDFTKDVVSGWCAADLADKYNISVNVVRWAAKRNGLTLVDMRHKNSGATRTFEYAEAVRLREAGQTLQAIGDRFGVTRERIRQVLIIERCADLKRLEA